MSALHPYRAFAAATLAVAMLAGLPASAQALNPIGNTFVQQNNLQTLENQLQRQQYQQQQQQYRAQDRQIVPQQPVVVPRLKPSCQTQIIGTTAVGNCR